MINALVGHLVGDFILQTDSMASAKKTNSFVCVCHVIIYTAVVLVFSHWPMWTAPLIAIPHFAIDRTQFVYYWMDCFGQKSFRDDMGPWSVIIVDQVLHITCLWFLRLMFDLPI